MILLSVIPFALLAHAFHRRGESGRASLLLAATAWGVLLAAIVEFLSLFHWLTRPALALAWCAVSAAAALWLKLDPAPARPEPQPAPRIPWSRPEKLLLAGAVFLAALIGLTALVSPPNTIDAMNYHLPRVAAWISNRSVAFFPTVDYRQITHSPWAEYAMLNAALLNAGDRFVNLVAFFAYLGSALAVSAIAALLGANRAGQLLAAIAALTIPEFVLEASGPMNTGVGAFWIASALVFLLRWSARPSLAAALPAGAAIGLAVFTKETAYIFIPPLVIAAWLLVPRPARVPALRWVALMALLTGAVNAPQYARTWALSGTPIGSTDHAESVNAYVVQGISAAKIAANVLRNLALHTGTPIASLNHALDHAFRSAITSLGQNPDDPSANWDAHTFGINPTRRFEVLAGNPVHAAAFVLTAILIAVAWRRLRRGVPVLAAALALGFLLFCALLKWQAFGARFHLPLFLAGAALLGALCSQPRFRSAGLALAALFLIQALPFALANEIRPLAPTSSGSVLTTPRDTLYFADQSDYLRPSFAAAARFVRQAGCSDVAVDAVLERYNYPLFAFLMRDNPALRFHYTGFTNSSSRYALPDQSTPCAVICLNCRDVTAKWCQYRSVASAASVFDDAVVFSSRGSLPNSPTPEQCSLDNARLLAAASASSAAFSSVAAFNLAPVARQFSQAIALHPADRASLNSQWGFINMLRFRTRNLWDAAQPDFEAAAGNDWAHVDRLRLASNAQALVRMQSEFFSLARSFADASRPTAVSERRPPRLAR